MVGYQPNVTFALVKLNQAGQKTPFFTILVHLDGSSIDLIFHKSRNRATTFIKMRLINTQSMMLEEFMSGGNDAPPYAILSHTWGVGEVTFQDFIHPDPTIRSQKLGFGKIEKTCQLARNAGLKYVWVDTCCIDKSSSAEITEAINSMFLWYKYAVVCLAWLADLAPGDGLSQKGSISLLKDCKWFTRGWTLQELIAPKKLEIYDREWNLRGTKAELSDTMSNITNIDAAVLQDTDLLNRRPIAQRMSWVATRQTTRVEDMAYCLLGIFDVNMPMLYGEGSRAFIRLQEEIIKESNDLSLFAWKAPARDQKHRGILASSPSEFQGSGFISLINHPAFNPDFLMTNKGLHITVDLHPGLGGTYLMGLNCAQPAAKGDAQHIGIWVQPHGGGVYSRANSGDFGIVNPDGIGKTTRTTNLFIHKRVAFADSTAMEGSHRDAFMMREGFNALGAQVNDPDIFFEAKTIEPMADWDSQRRMFLNHGASSFTAFVWMWGRRQRDSRNFLVAFGKSEESIEPWLTIEGTNNVNGRKNMRLYSKDLNKLGAIGRTRDDRTLTLDSKFTYASLRVDVSLEKAVVDGQSVHCIDISYTEQ